VQRRRRVKVTNVTDSGAFAVTLADRRGRPRDGWGRACSSTSLDHKRPAVGKGELPSADERLRSNREAASRAGERRRCREEQPHAAMPGAWWTGCRTDVTGFTPVTGSTLRHDSSFTAAIALTDGGARRIVTVLTRFGAAVALVRRFARHHFIGSIWGSERSRCPIALWDAPLDKTSRSFGALR
jgi:hypothetical protein